MAQVLTAPKEVNRTHSTVAFAPTQPARKTLDERIEAAIAEARAITDTKGVESRESAVAWDIVEELLAAAAHKREKEPKTAFDRYCEENPSALEALMYDV